MDRLDWNLVRAFHVTAEAGSLSAAARVLGLTQPTLSRQIAALEAQLNATLFDRVGKKLVLTTTGLGLIEHAHAMGTAADTLALAAAGRAQDVGGSVRISATDAVAAYLLPSVITRLREAAPQVMLTIVASNALSDIRRREADIAIRHVRPSEPELIGRLVGEMEARFYASQDWISAHGLPRSRADLSAGVLMGGEPLDRYCSYLETMGFTLAADDFRIVSESSVVLWEMVRRGLGIGIMVRDVAERCAGIVDVLPELPPIVVPVWLVTHQEMRTSRRIRLVFDALAEALSASMLDHERSA